MSYSEVTYLILLLLLMLRARQLMLLAWQLVCNSHHHLGHDLKKLMINTIGHCSYT